MKNDFKLSLKLLRETLMYAEDMQLVTKYKPATAANLDYIRRELIRLELEYKVKKIVNGVDICVNRSDSIRK